MYWVFLTPFSSYMTCLSALGLLDWICSQVELTSSFERRVAQHTCPINGSSTTVTNWPPPWDYAMGQVMRQTSALRSERGMRHLTVWTVMYWIIAYYFKLHAKSAEWLLMFQATTTCHPVFSLSYGLRKKLKGRNWRRSSGRLCSPVRYGPCVCLILCCHCHASVLLVRVRKSIQPK